MFGNTTVAIAPDHILTMICTPEAVDRCTVSIALFVTAAAAVDPALAANRESLLTDWMLVTEQGPRRARAATGGPCLAGRGHGEISPFWEATAHYFEQRVVEQLT